MIVNHSPVVAMIVAVVSRGGVVAPMVASASQL